MSTSPVMKFVILLHARKLALNYAKRNSPSSYQTFTIVYVCSAPMHLDMNVDRIQTKAG